jgi:hypothetical protein
MVYSFDPISLTDDCSAEFQSPLENQSYSNNPRANQGRANPVLPRPIQDRLEEVGLISQDAEPVKSSQAIDLKKRQVRNVVSFAIPSLGQSRKASVTGMIHPNYQHSCHELHYILTLVPSSIRRSIGRFQTQYIGQAKSRRKVSIVQS